MRVAGAPLTAAQNRSSIASLIAIGALAGSVAMHGQRAITFDCDADNGGLTLPAGFCAGVIADNLGVARNLAVAPNGDLFVSVRVGPNATPGFILGLRDTNGDGRIDVQEKFGTRARPASGSATGICITRRRRQSNASRWRPAS